MPGRRSFRREERNPRRGDARNPYAWKRKDRDRDGGPRLPNTTYRRDGGQDSRGNEGNPQFAGKQNFRGSGARNQQRGGSGTSYSSGARFGATGAKPFRKPDFSR